MQRHTLIIGIGNRYRGDDAFGCIVAAEVAGMVPAGVACIEHDGEPAALMDCWQGAGRVLLIDAVCSGAPAGEIFRFNLAREILSEEFDQCSTHAFGLAQAVELARALHRLPPEISFIGVEGQCFDAGAALSPPLLQAKDAVIAEIMRAYETKETAHARILADGRPAA